MIKNSGSLLHTGNDLFELEPLLHVFFLFVHFLVVTSWDRFVLRQGDLFLLRNAHVLIRRLKQLLLWPQSLHWEEFGLWSFGTWTHIWVKADHLRLILIRIFINYWCVARSNCYQLCFLCVLFLFCDLGLSILLSLFNPFQFGSLWFWCLCHLRCLSGVLLRPTRCLFTLLSLVGFGFECLSRPIHFYLLYLVIIIQNIYRFQQLMDS